MRPRQAQGRKANKERSLLALPDWPLTLEVSAGSYEFRIFQSLQASMGGKH